MKVIGNPDTMSANPNDELQGELKEREFVERKPAWTLTDEAIHRGHNYADAREDETVMLMREGMTFHGALKNAYQEGFLHGFEHKFDDTHYEGGE